MHRYYHSLFSLLYTWRRSITLFAVTILLAASAAQLTVFTQTVSANVHALTANSPSEAVYAGEVFIDLNRNGIREHQETGIQDIVVRIESLDGGVINETASDEHGIYVFTNLSEQTVRVRVMPPDVFRISANGDYVISTSDPHSPTVRSTGLFIGLYIPYVGGD